MPGIRTLAVSRAEAVLYLFHQKGPWHCSSSPPEVKGRSRVREEEEEERVMEVKRRMKKDTEGGTSTAVLLHAPRHGTPNVLLGQRDGTSGGKGVESQPSE